MVALDDIRQHILEARMGFVREHQKTPSKVHIPRRWFVALLIHWMLHGDQWPITIYGMEIVPHEEDYILVE